MKNFRLVRIEDKTLGSCGRWGVKYNDIVKYAGEITQLNHTGIGILEYQGNEKVCEMKKIIQAKDFYDAIISTRDSETTRAVNDFFDNRLGMDSDYLRDEIKEIRKLWGFSY